MVFLKQKGLKIFHFITFHLHEQIAFCFNLKTITLVTITLSQYNSLRADFVINDVDYAWLLNLHSFCGASVSFLAFFPSYVAHLLLANNTSSKSTTGFLCCMPALIYVSYVTHVLLDNSASPITVFLCSVPTLRIVF